MLSRARRRAAPLPQALVSPCPLPPLPAATADGATPPSRAPTAPARYLLSPTAAAPVNLLTPLLQDCTPEELPEGHTPLPPEWPKRKLVNILPGSCIRFK